MPGCAQTKPPDLSTRLGRPTYVGTSSHVTHWKLHAPAASATRALIACLSDPSPVYDLQGRRIARFSSLCHNNFIAAHNPRARRLEAQGEPRREERVAGDGREGETRGERREENGERGEETTMAKCRNGERGGREREAR